jgi:hypothetical protein
MLWDNPDHRALRKAIAREVATGMVQCAGRNGCGELIRPGEAWDLGHLDGQPGRYCGPQHARCNQSTAGKRRAW